MKQDANEMLRRKLDGLEASETDPGFQPDLFWNQLDQQLHPPVRIRIWMSRWYWAHAAAFLIGGVLLAFWLQSARPQPIAGSAPTHSSSTVQSTSTVQPASEASQPSPVVLPQSKPDPLPEAVAVTHTAPAKARVSNVSVPEAVESEPVPIAIPTPIPAPPSVAKEVPRALYLTDVAPQTSAVVAETPQQPLSKKRPFFLSSEPFQTQTAFQRPASVWKGLRP